MQPHAPKIARLSINKVLIALSVVSVIISIQLYQYTPSFFVPGSFGENIFAYPISLFASIPIAGILLFYPVRVIHWFYS
jgi:hypothetical protein